MNDLELFQNPTVRIEGDLVCLNDIWVLGGSPAMQTPPHWHKTERALQLIDALAKNLNSTKSDIYNSLRGRHHGGTWAHKLLALEYAGYLSPDLRLRINDTYLRVKAGDYSVIEEVLDNQSPAEQQRSAKRVQGKVTRNQLTATLQEHGVKGGGYAQCTDSLYRPLLGGSAAKVREERNLPVRANLRDSMSMKELAAVELAEILAKEQIEHDNPQGNTPCANTCYTTARRVASIL